MSAFKRYRDAGIVVLLLAVPFFFLRANMKARSKDNKEPPTLNAVDRVVLRVSAPIEFAASSLARGISNVWESYVYLVDVKADNDRLAYENARLREQVHRLEQKETENRELKRMLQLKQSTTGELVSAQVVGRDATPFFRVDKLVLDRGSQKVKENMPVISPDGVVGKVLHIEGDSVQVQLAVDARFGIDVEDERTHARGWVRGSGDEARYYCKVEHVDSRDEVEIGDLLVTSGKGKFLPKGIPVARVTKVLKREPGRDQEIEATPTVSFSRLDWVSILVTTPADEPEESGTKKATTSNAKQTKP
jgi:rod shape-determining protein MreC